MRMIIPKFSIIKPLFLLVIFAGMSARPAGADGVRSAHVEAELISEFSSVRPESSFLVALKMKMDPGWHVYWQNPGDSGLPPNLTWQLPEGLTSGDILWPVPKKIVYDPLVSYGYEDETWLTVPMRISGEIGPGTDIELKLKATWLACEKICIPGEGRFSLRIPVKDASPSLNENHRVLFQKIKNHFPEKQTDWAVEAEEYENTLVLSLRPAGTNSPVLERMDFFPFSDRLIDHAGAQTFKKAQDGYRLEIPKQKNAADHERLEGVLIADKNWAGQNSKNALEISVPLKKSTAEKTVTAEPYRPRTPSLRLAVLFAFLGGLLLNLMPCVLPVLSIKILNFSAHANQSRGRSFLQGGLYTLGVLISFWILAGTLIALRLTGAEIGWGFQLQSPAFLLFLIFIFFLFMLNLFDVYEIGTSLTRIGNIRIKSESASSFLSGTLAVLVATPCTAPYMGTALGYAVTQSNTAAFTVFTALGFGMAFPYLVLSGAPEFARILPRPGKWMIRLKQFLAALLGATCLWLIWVLSLQIGTGKPLLLIFSGLLLTGIAAWVYGKWARPAEKKNVRSKAVVLSALLITAGIFIAAQAVTRFGESAIEKDSAAHAGWDVFSENKLEELLNQKHPVFIDFTAAWCLTCQVNDRLVFQSANVQRFFSEKNIILLKADWTSKDEAITKALAGYGRNSIPLYVYYPAGSREPHILPEAITPKRFIQLLKEADAFTIS